MSTVGREWTRCYQRCGRLDVPTSQHLFFHPPFFIAATRYEVFRTDWITVVYVCQSVTEIISCFIIVQQRSQIFVSLEHFFLLYQFRADVYICVCPQAVPHLDASPPLHPVVSLSSGLPPHELLLCCQTGCRGGLSNPEPQRGAETTSHHQGAPYSYSLYKAKFVALLCKRFFLKSFYFFNSKDVCIGTTFCCCVRMQKVWKLWGFRKSS